jgi:hypothetical protein
MPSEYNTDGEVGFYALNSRDNPATLEKGVVTKSVNMRLERGIAVTRTGLKKFYDASIVNKNIVGAGVYVDDDGQESIILLVDDPALEVTRIVSFNTNTTTFFNGPALPQRITSGEGVDVVHALNAIYITRGHLLRPLRWDLASTVIEIPTNDEFPNSIGVLYYQNRFITIGKHLSPSMANARRRDTICVSHFLQYNKFPLADAFTINQGGNDEVVALVPWTLNEIVILCRNSTFYLNVGTHRYTSGESLASDAKLETLSIDVGCAARKSAVQVGDGVIFLSDDGVYVMAPTSSGKPDGVKLLTIADPLSAPIDDVINRINKDFIAESVGTYWNNRYYLAVPLDNSEVNNAVLVYNFILKAWESVDTYPSAIDFITFITGKRNKQRRLFGIDPNEGIFLMEESVNDEIGERTGTPVLGTESARLSWTLASTSYSGSQPIQGELITRRFTAGEGKDKRFSSIETDMHVPAGAIVETSAITTNYDTETVIDLFQWTKESDDTTRRNPVRKTAYGLQIKFRTLRLQPSIRSNFVKFTMSGKNNMNSK